MFHNYWFHFGITIFVFYRRQVFLKKMFLKIAQNSQENTCTGVSFLSAACDFINEETLAQYFPKSLTIFVKSSIADVQLDYKYTSVLPPDLKPRYKDFLL